MSIKHTVILNFDKSHEVDFLDLVEQTRPIIEAMLGIQQYLIVKNESLYTPEYIFSVGVYIEFENDEAFSYFMASPKHYEANTLFEQYLAEPPYSVLTYHGTE